MHPATHWREVFRATPVETHGSVTSSHPSQTLTSSMLPANSVADYSLIVTRNADFDTEQNDYVRSS